MLNYFRKKFNVESKQFLKNINAEIGNYDVLINSPSIDSGVSIDVKHFDAVFGVFMGGIIPAWTLSQGLNRVRDNVLRYVWVNDNTGEIKETDSQKLINWALQNYKDNAALLGDVKRNSDNDAYTIAYSEFGRLWSKLTVNRN